MAAALELLIWSIDIAAAWLTAILQGWLYALSPRFRREVHARWERQTQMQKMADVTGGVFGVVSSLALVLWAAAALVGRV